MSKFTAALVSFLGLVLGLSALGQAPGKPLKEGSTLPAAFDCYNFNGKAKGRQHCLICEFGLRPSVLVFAREAEESATPVLNDLIRKLDEYCEEHNDQEVRAAIVFLSPDARSSATGEKAAEGATALLEQHAARKKLVDRLSARAQGLKHVRIAMFPAEGPKDFGLSPTAETTILLCYKLRILELKTYEPGQMQTSDNDALLESLTKAYQPPALTK